MHTNTQESQHTTPSGTQQDGFTPEFLERSTRKQTLWHIWEECKLSHQDGEHRGCFLNTEQLRDQTIKQPHSCTSIGRKRSFKKPQAFWCSLQHPSKEPRWGGNQKSIQRWMEKADVIQNIVKWCSDFKEQDLMTHTEKRTDLWMVRRSEVRQDKAKWHLPALTWQV